MTLLLWIAFGLVSGFVANKTINKSGRGLVLDLALGIAGALAGGWFFNTFGMAAGSGLNADSFIVAIGGAIVFLTSYHLLVRSENYQAFVGRI
jgi:uncharacterized membrane protein YeaQ/YmgE (transglycosylase-associated protein family)